jgi:Ricin-type beta-trefoil lectin domain/Putative Ig domain
VNVFTSLRRARRPASAGVFIAAAGLVTAGLMAVPASAAHVPQRAAPPPAAGAQPRAVKLPAGVRAVCPVPALAGQAQCMALARTNTRHYRGMVAHQAPPGYGPASLQSAYGLTSAASSGGTGETVAVVDAYDDPNAAADLAVYRAQYGLPACDTSTGAGCVTKVNEQGASSPLPAPMTDWASEESLDLDMVSAICPNCHILLVEATTAALTDLGAADDTAVSSGAVFVSDSWNAGEFPSESYYDNLYFNRPGVAIAVAAGDSGYGTTWPSSSQYVISVGGTTLTADSGVSRGYTETAWKGTGSGCAEADPKPSWQTVDDSSPTGCLNRTQNDVSAVANPSTGVAVYDSYNASGWSEVGGTSVATPIVASAYALAGAPTAGTYPASYLYQTGHAAALNDVTSGSNGTCEPNRQYLCNAETGYDGPTGLGTPDGTAAFKNSLTGNVVTLTDPGSQDLEAGEPVFVAMRGVDSAGAALTYSATGLPSGLSIGHSSGRITGTPGTTTGSFAVTVTAKDKTGATGSVTFSIVALPSLATGYHGVSGPVDLDMGGKCLDDFHDGTGQGNVIDIYTCNGTAAQNWEYQPGGAPGQPGTVTINGKCMDAPGTTKGKPSVVLDLCDGAASQSWLIDGSAGQLYNTNTGKCLSDPGSSTRNGTQLVVAGCTSKSNQAWIPPASPVQSGISSHCMDDSRDGSANGNKIQIWACNGTDSQKWITEPDETLRIAGKCLTVTGSSTLDGAKAELDACNSSSKTNANQHWYIGSTGELINANSGRCLDDPGNNPADGTALVQEDCYGQPGEIWAVT